MYTTRSSAILSSLLLLGARSVAADCTTAWPSVAQDLTASFVGCGDFAKQAIRASYHDCVPGSCDGSLILTDECATRPENSQIRPYCAMLKERVLHYGVSAADALQLGLFLAVKSCAGPDLTFQIGRTDSYTANPPNQLPPITASAEEQVAAFTKFPEQGFTASDVVALSGAHTIGKNLQNIALDTTDQTWDNVFYSNVLYHSAPATLQSDQNLATSDETTSPYHSFAISASGWEYAFAQAYGKMSTIGNNKASLTDCTAAIESAVPN